MSEQESFNIAGTSQKNDGSPGILEGEGHGDGVNKKPSTEPRNQQPDAVEETHPRSMRTG